jgi:tetraacyldisaccharide 4'-kinase
MREPAFWWQAAGAMSAALSPLGSLYDAAARHQMRKEGLRVGVPVVCIGDPTVGGAGKTPTAIAVARMLAAMGRRPAFLTRGYKGALKGPVIVAAEHHAGMVGDEPMLLARVALTVVARNRVAGAAVALAHGADVLILDDGFQNHALVKDFSFLVVDGHRGVGNRLPIPAGPLRADLDFQIARAHAMAVIGNPSPLAQAAIDMARRSGIPVWGGRLAPDPSALAKLAGKRVLAFAGIGHPHKFFATLGDAGIAVAQALTFPDHHAYTPEEAADLVRRGERDGLSVVTTEKDFVRLTGAPEREELARRTTPIPVTLEFEDSGAVAAALSAVIQGYSAGPDGRAA